MNKSIIVFALIISSQLFGQDIKTKNRIFSSDNRKSFQTSNDKYQLDALESRDFSDFKTVKVDQVFNKLDIIRLNVKTGAVDTIFHKIRYGEYVSFQRSGLGLTAVNIPFKARPSLDTIPLTAETDLKNFGIYVGYSRHLDHYFFSGRQSTHSFTSGGFFSPIGISLNPENTRGKVKASTQFGISLGVGFSYSYDKVSVMLIPMAWDFGVGSQAQNWIYTGKYWFGFGLGIETGFFFAD